MTDPVPSDAAKVEVAAKAAVATVATDAKAVGSAVSGVVATVKKYAPHVAVAAGGFVAGHYVGGVVFTVLRHII